MPPIRVALIGLGPFSTAGYKSGEWGIQHMNAILHSPYFELVAVCNSSVSSAERSIKAHNLSPTVKAYGSPSEVALDPDVDLIAVAVKIDHHYTLAKAALQQKKHLIVEFPFMPSTAQTEELAALAAAGGVRTMVSAQARADPAVRKLKEIVANKTIGEVISSTFTGHFPITTSNGWPQKDASFLDLGSGANRFTVGIGHPFDAFVHVLGTFQVTQSLFKISDTTSNLLDENNKVVERDYSITTPDTILVQGVLDSGSIVSFGFRTSASTADGVGFRWVISGTRGEVVFTGGIGVLQMGLPNAKLQLSLFDSGSEELQFGQAESAHPDGVEPRGANVWRLYNAFAKGESEAFSTIEQTLETEKMLLEIRQKAVYA